jgi:putative DNA primase/helicase
MISDIIAPASVDASSGEYACEHGTYSAYVAGGLSPIAVRPDKRPLPWKRYQSAAMAMQTARVWDTTGMMSHYGVGIVTGIVSGGLEVIDFDSPDCFPPWRRLVESIVCDLPIVETPRGGNHVYYRCEKISGNTVIAADPTGKKPKIETRGEGGYVVAPGGACIHPTGLPYVQIAGPSLTAVPTISPAERLQLWRAAEQFDEAELAKQAAAREIARRQRLLHPPQPSAEGTPWEDFNRGATWESVLIPHGWTTRDGVEWSRPGKTDGGLSAKVCEAADGHRVLCVYSSSAGVLSPDSENYKSWNLFAAYAALNHAGDFKAAARELRKQGWGK